MEEYTSISFSGGGWLGIYYYLGVIQYIREVYPDIEFITLGTSAGAWAATIMQLLFHKFIDLDILEKEIDLFMDSLHVFPVMCKDEIFKFINDLIVLKDSEIQQFGPQLFISYTEIKQFSPKNRLVNPISDLQLKNSLIYSSLIPGMIGLSLEHIDGFFTNNQPIIDDKTLKINCIYKRGADIYPSEWKNLMYIFKRPDADRRCYLKNLGYQDMSNFDKELKELKNMYDDIILYSDSLVIDYLVIVPLVTSSDNIIH